MAKYCAKCGTKLEEKKTTETDDQDRTDAMWQCLNCNTYWVSTYHKPSKSWSFNEVATDAK